MMRGARTTGWVITGMAVATVAAAPLRAQMAPISGTELAIALEAEALRLQQSARGWADAADLFMAAAGHRQHEDPQARQDLFMAANLYHQVGNVPRAIMALESAGVRAMSSGDAVLAVQMFGNAAEIAGQAGLFNEERRLRTRATDVAAVSRSGSGTRS